MNTQEYIAIEDRYNAHNYKPLDVVLTRGEGVWVEDVDGKKYMDFLAAYSAVNQGHCHPRLVKVMVEQAARLALTSRAFRNDQLPLLARELCELSGYEMMLPMNSGAEAVETAIKVARKWGYEAKGVRDEQAHIITCYGNFHGRTITIVSFSSEEQYREGFGPFTPGFRFGGIETLLLGLYRHIDRDRFQFDFVTDTIDALDEFDEIRSMGGRVHQFGRYLDNPFLYHRKFVGVIAGFKKI